jgi:hypothetical protein
MTLHACNNQSHFTVNLRNHPEWMDMERLGPALRPAHLRCQAGQSIGSQSWARRNRSIPIAKSGGHRREPDASNLSFSKGRGCTGPDGTTGNLLLARDARSHRDPHQQGYDAGRKERGCRDRYEDRDPHHPVSGRTRSASVRLTPVGFGTARSAVANPTLQRSNCLRRLCSFGPALCELFLRLEPAKLPNVCFPPPRTSPK